MKINKIIFYHLDRYGRKIEYFVDPHEAKVFKIWILEKSVTENLGQVYMQDENGNIILLDYYNS